MKFNWLAFITDLITVAAPIVAAHSKGNTQQIATAVGQVAPLLHSASAGNDVSIAPAPSGPTLSPVNQGVSTLR